MGLGPFQPNLGVQNQQIWLQDLYQKLLALQTQTNSSLDVVGLVLSNNNPDSNDITWSACTIYLNGTAYPIAAGNTTGGAALVWWNVGDATFSTGNSYTPSPTTYPILTNVAGTADTTWDKTGAASIQSSQVIGGLLPPGYQVQPPATINTSVGGTYTFINYSGTGALLSFGFAANIVTTAPGCQLSINVDGAGAQIYQLTTPSNPSTDPPSPGFGLSSAAAAILGGNQGLVSFFQIPFKVSLVVQVTINALVSGTFQAAAAWAKKV